MDAQLVQDFQDLAVKDAALLPDGFDVTITNTPPPPPPIVSETAHFPQ